MNTRNRILEAAMKNFLRLGYEGSSLAMISEDVGIKKPSLYYHFKSKEDLYIQSILFLIASIEDKLEKRYDKSKQPKENLEAFFNMMLEVNSELSLLSGNSFNHTFNVIGIFRDSAERFPALREPIDQYYDSLRQKLQRILKAAQKGKYLAKDADPAGLSLELLAWMEGMFMLSEVYSGLDIHHIRAKFYHNMWVMIFADEPDTKGIFKKKSKPKALSLGTKW